MFVAVKVWYPSFNTSHVTVYHLYESTKVFKILVSIHLMLLFITKEIYLCASCRSVSIHLMLLFIRRCQDTGKALLHVSIHLMLLFIDIQKVYSDVHFKFQYISCYCLSPSVNSLNVMSCRFNTSHVTVYPFRQ